MNMIKPIKLFIFLFGGLLFAQSTMVTGRIAPVETDGLHRIQIPQNMRSYASRDLRDLRIKDAKGHEVPYFIQPGADYTSTQISDFEEFVIVSKTREADTSSTYVFKNPLKTIESVVLLVANYQGSKNYRLEGSHNQKNWFGIVNNGQLNQLNHSSQTSVYKDISFPLCSYQFIKIVFDDRYSLPINLLKIGTAHTQTISTVPVMMENIPVEGLEFLEKDKTTQMHIRFKRKEVVNQIKIDIDAPSLYNRNAVLYTLKQREVKRKMETYRHTLARFSIRSDGALIFDIPSVYEQELYLEIDNKDNPKLDIKRIDFMQKPVYLIAALKKNELYKVTAGNTNLNFPNYDLYEVTTASKSELPIAKITEIVYKQPEQETLKSPSFWQQSWFMWTSIGVATLMILYVVSNLIKDLNTNKKT